MPMPRPSRAKALVITGQECDRLTRVQAKLAELNAPKLRDKLLDATEVRRTWGGVRTTMRAAMLAVPSQIGSRLLHLDATDLDAIDRPIRDGLAEIATDDA
jgi:terminase small subunit / prophage DNA-packing protein